MVVYIANQTIDGQGCTRSHHDCLKSARSPLLISMTTDAQIDGVRLHSPNLQFYKPKILTTGLPNLN